jgi:hypothetical protein
MVDGDPSEFERMVRGEMYSASDPYVRAMATQQAAKARAINEERDDEERDRLLRAFYNVKEGTNFYVVAPTFVEYVCHTFPCRIQ